MNTLKDRLAVSQNLSDDNLGLFAWLKGYRLCPEDCQEIRGTAYSGETVSHAVEDFLNAYEA
jgi:hypothetical protein